MLRLSKGLLLMILILVSVHVGEADEGMWMPHQMKELNLNAQGLKMDPGELYKADGTGIMNAVVNLGGGTGAFVSKEGLILTNHHVAFGVLQQASDKEHDYINNGFLAQTISEEIPAEGYYADVLLGYEDVTPYVLKKLKPSMTPEQRYNALDRIEKKLVAKAEKKGKDLYCSFKSMYSGNKYYLFKYKRLRDVRIVYAPPRSLGNFGGEIDNWMWPRHTCDFTFLRAYISKDNTGAPYDSENIPYQPKSFLKISLKGVKEGEFTFSMGYPVTTQRNYTLSELRLEMEDMEYRVNLYRQMVDFIEKVSKKDRGIRIKYISRLRSIQNGLKNRIAKLEGLQKYSVPEKKRIFEEKLQQWISEQPQGQKKYQGILTKIEDFMQRNADFYRKQERVDILVSSRLGPTLLAQAHLIYRTVEERQKPDIKREPRFQKKDLPDIRSRVELAERGYEPDIDSAYFKFLLNQMVKSEKVSWPKCLVPVLEKGAEGINSYVDQLYAATVLKDPEKRMGLIELKPSELLALNDPLINLTAEIEKELKVLRQKEKILDQQLSDLKKVYMAALLEMLQGKIAPDANASIRFTYGPVKRYYPRDGVVYLSQTTLTGVMEKETGTFPFEVPQKLKKLYQARDFGRYMDKDSQDIVTCFINTTNVTGGSSGSPVMNAHGEIVGISFDMVYESVIGDFFIIAGIQRVINVDIRYVLFITDKFSNASNLLKEMGL